VVTLGNLLDAVDIETEVLGRRDVTIGGLTVDSRRVRAGDLFFALEGQHEDGHRFVQRAVAEGAVAVVATRREPAWGGVPVVVTGQVRRCLGVMAARFYGDPSRRLTAAAVTGTNGKTTITYLLEAIWRANGTRAGVIGTVNYRHTGTLRPAVLTTPEALDLQAELATMVEAGVRGVAVEVSSHALALERVRGCHWDVAVFTNLSHDHLDFHGNLESYFQAKATLFHDHLCASAKPDPVAVVNVDDPRGARLAREIRGRLVTFGRSAGATVHPLDVEQTLSGIRGALCVAGERVAVESSLIGEPHLANLMAAAGAAHGLGLPMSAVEAGFRDCAVVPGRMERLHTANGFSVFVDYAHTPHALECTLMSLRPITAGRIITVFGCGGDRDPTKRPVMGEIAGRLSDVVVLTSDNPRTEDPCGILRDIERGIAETCLARVEPGALAGGESGYTVDVDRRRAIGLALQGAQPGDSILVAGKGHENYQLVGADRRRFDDREEVRSLLGLAS
jgi:UDP-N-acetylmuramoyl-L-alanyl-D-glutamate--2,6-diaminopimelate ligase